MKKLYFLLIALAFGAMSFGQDVLTEIDVDGDSSSNNPSDSGNFPDVSSVGFTRGPGAIYDPGADYAVEGLNEPDVASAILSGDYIQFSISTGASNVLDLSQLEIKLGRRNPEGPTDFRIDYSTDGFSTNGIPLMNTDPMEMNPDGSSSFQTVGRKAYAYDLNVISSISGTVTFRMYMWGGDPNDSADSLMKIFASTSSNNNPSGAPGNVVWNNYISSPGAGARILGSVFMGGDSDSDIVSTSFDPTDNIAYDSFNTTSGLTTSNAIKVGEFTIRDGGASSPDGDSNPTVLNDISFNISNFSNIAALAIFDGATNVAEVTAITPTTNFVNINGGSGLSAPDDGTKTFDLYASFNTSVVDNQQLQFTVNTTSTVGASSQFAANNAGGAFTPVTGDDNRIEVTATTLSFFTQPSDVSVNTTMSPSPIVRAVDANGTIDLDYTSIVTLTPSTLNSFAASATTSVNAISGQATFINLVFQTGGTNFSLTADSGSLINSPQSSNFNVIAPSGAGWQITQTNTEFLINFDTTVSGVNNGLYNGTGNIVTPALGQLDSNSWSLSGTTGTGASTFNQTNNTGIFTRGLSQGGVTDGGFYAFDIDNNAAVGAQNHAFGIQPSASVLTPGNVTLRAKNATGNTIVSVLLQYTVYVYNDQPASNSLNLAYSTSNSGSYTPLTAQAVVSETVADTGTDLEWVSYNRTVVINGLNIPDSDSGFFYMRWRLGDSSVDGDEFAIDDVRVTFNTTVNTLFTYDANAVPNWSPSNPDGSTATGNIIQISNGDVEFVQPTTNANVVDVRPGASLTLSNSANLIVSDELTLDSNSQQYSSLDIRDGSVTGTINYNRHVNDFASPGSTTGDNDIISAPLTSPSQTFGTFRMVDGNNIPSGNIGGAPELFYLFGPYDNISNPSRYVNWTSANDSEVLTAGVGYRTASSSTSDDTFLFTGEVQTGDVFVPITNGNSPWNAIGNPYPSFLDPAAFLNLLSNQNLMDENAVGIYGYDGSAQDGWTVINLNNMNFANYIAPGQGFLISATSSGTITFTTDMMTISSNDDFILGRNADNQYLKLEITHDTKRYPTEFYFNDNSSLGLDPGYDAALINVAIPQFYMYSHLVEENNGQAMAMQSLSLENLNDVSIPLGVKANQGQQITFSIAESTIAEGIDVLLEDIENNTFTNLNAGDYTFTADSNIDGTGRFFLRTSNSTLSTLNPEANSLQVFSSDNIIFIKGQLSGATNVSVYDVQGRVVLRSTLNGGTMDNQLSASSLNSGIYIVKLNNSTQQKTQKVIIK
ncbi:MAG: T9SS type A sorting domain-containing protein [Psychroserpens sp.]|uniref:T9SS type A sorting domain-containing protein n=1 Tax=Psychroserpens sp. TaxID=2020870 RepID=UPI003C741FC0